MPKPSQPFMALITPFYADVYPDQGLPGSQPRPDNTLPGGQGGRPDNTLPGDLPIPSHPIYFPLPPGAPVDPSYGIDINAPYPDQGLPGSQPRPDNTLPGSQPHPDQGLPGSQPRPDQGLPAFPSHPIVLPPGGGGGWLPVYIWGPSDPRPGTGLPGDQPYPDQGLPIPPPTDEEKAKVEWKAMWTPTTGWVSFAVVVPGAGTPVPTPSKGRK